MFGTYKSSPGLKTGQRFDDDQLSNSKSPLGQTSGNWANSASLKGKLMSLEDMVKQIAEDMDQYRRDAQVLDQINSMERDVGQQLQDMKKELLNNLGKIEDNMKKNFAQQKAENSRIQQQITSLKGEKTALQQQLLGLQRRISEIEMQVGSEETLQ